MRELTIEKLESMVREAKTMGHVRSTSVEKETGYSQRKEIFFKINFIRLTHDLKIADCHRVTGYNYSTFSWIKKYMTQKVSTEKAIDVLNLFKGFVELMEKVGKEAAIEISEKKIAEIKAQRLQPGGCCTNSSKEIKAKEALFDYFIELFDCYSYTIQEYANICRTSKTTIHYAKSRRFGKISIKTLGTIISHLEAHQ